MSQRDVIKLLNDQGTWVKTKQIIKALSDKINEQNVYEALRKLRKSNIIEYELRACERGRTYYYRAKIK